MERISSNNDWLLGIQTMESQGVSDSHGKHSQLQPLVRQNSMYSLTLDEVQNQLGDLGKPLSSMNLDELLQYVWMAEANQSISMDGEGAAQTSPSALQRQTSLSLTRELGKKTVDEVWRDIQQSKENTEKKSQERQLTLGEMTLEDFLVKAGIVTDNRKSTSPIVGVDSNAAAPQFSPQGPWMQYQQPQYPHMGGYIPSQSITQHTGAGAALDASYDSQVALPSPLMGTLADSKVPGRRRGMPEDIIEKTIERRQKRMIKNRESAARSRARKQAYTTELETKVSRLEEENQKLRKQKFCCTQHKFKLLQIIVAKSKIGFI